MSKNIWEEFATDAPENFILTGSIDYSSKDGIKEFFESGIKFTEETQENVSALLSKTDRALEIGCGVGRLTLPHANVFNEVVAIDISPKMLEYLNRNASQFNQKNITTFLPSENWDDYSFDYAYSFLVFQHIENFNIIEWYIKRISLSLNTGGIAQLQFDTRRPGMFYKIRNILPDFLVPSTQQRGIRRIRRNPDELRQMFKNYKLKILKEMFPNSMKHFFILQKNPGKN